VPLSCHHSSATATVVAIMRVFRELSMAAQCVLSCNPLRYLGRELARPAQTTAAGPDGRATDVHFVIIY
jgi:hypothetical protein